MLCEQLADGYVLWNFLAIYAYALYQMGRSFSFEDGRVVGIEKGVEIEKRNCLKKHELLERLKESSQ